MIPQGFWISKLRRSNQAELLSRFREYCVLVAHRLSAVDLVPIHRVPNCFAAVAGAL